MKKNYLTQLCILCCLLAMGQHTWAQCISVSPGTATANCSTGEIAVTGTTLTVDAGCLANVGGFAVATLIATDDDGTPVGESIGAMLMPAPTFFVPIPPQHYMSGPGTSANIMLLSSYFNGFITTSTTDWWDVGADGIQGTLDDVFAGTTVDPNVYMFVQSNPIVVKFTPGCTDPTMPNIDGIDLATPPIIPCNLPPDPLFVVDKTTVLPGENVTVTSVAPDPNGGIYALSQTTDVGATYSNCIPGVYSITNTAQYLGVTNDACPMQHTINYTVTDFPTNGPIIDEYTCSDQISSITDPTNADGFAWVYESGISPTYDNCTSVDVSGHWTINGCDGPIITGATNPQRCPFPTDNPTVVDNNCPSNTDGLFSAPADDPSGNFTWVWDAANPPTYDACLGTQTASGYWEDGECPSLTDARSVTSNPTQCCPAITDAASNETICSGSTATLPTITVDELALVGLSGFDWYVGDPNASGTVYDASIAESNTTCSPVDIVITSYVQCACTGLWIAGTTHTITVYPDPANFEVIVTPPTVCGAPPTVTVGSCAVMTTNAVTTSVINGCSSDADPTNDPVDGVYTHEQAALPAFTSDATGSTCGYPALVSGTTVIAACDVCTTCPTVTTPASGIDNICVGSAVDFATHATQITLSSGTVGTEATLTWWEDATFTIAAGTTALDAPTACTEQSITYFAKLVCVADGSDITGGGNFTVNVFHTYTEDIAGDGVCSQTYSVLDEDGNTCYTISSTSTPPAAACPPTTGVADTDPIMWTNPTNIPATCAFTPSLTATTASGCVGATNCPPTLSITDPCNCFAGINLDADPENELAQEIITITPGTAPYIVTAVTGLVDATGTALTPATATALISGLTITAYVPADGVSTYSLTIQDGNNLTDTITGGSCTVCPACGASPNMRWGN